jgi:hypothetical protein
MASARSYRVFVSSTYVDLVLHRQALHVALIRMGFIPAGMELFPASNTDVWRTIESEIESADYVIMVVAGRYGTIPARESRSYTEKEYDVARAARIPVFPFVISDKAMEQLPEPHRDRDPTALNSFRTRLTAELTASYWDSREQLIEQVQTKLASAVVRIPRPGLVGYRDLRRWRWAALGTSILTIILVLGVWKDWFLPLVHASGNRVGILELPRDARFHYMATFRMHDIKAFSEEAPWAFEDARHNTASSDKEHNFPLELLLLRAGIQRVLYRPGPNDSERSNVADTMFGQLSVAIEPDTMPGCFRLVGSGWYREDHREGEKNEDIWGLEISSKSYAAKGFEPGDEVQLNLLVHTVSKATLSFSIHVTIDDHGGWTASRADFARTGSHEKLLVYFESGQVGMSLGAVPVAVIDLSH